MIKETERKRDFRDDESDVDSEVFSTPRPSIMRPSVVTTNEALRRPSLARNSIMTPVRGSIVAPAARPGSVTSQLLAIINDSSTRRPGSLLLSSSAVNNNTTLDTTTDMDTTKDTTLDTTTEDVDERLNKLVLSRGYGTNVKDLPALRRPSGLGSFIKK